MSPVRAATVPNSSDSVSRLDTEMAELSLLLPVWWLAALEEAAADRGLSAAQLVRILIRDYLTR